MVDTKKKLSFVLTGLVVDIFWYFYYNVIVVLALKRKFAWAPADISSSIKIPIALDKTDRQLIQTLMILLLTST